MIVTREPPVVDVDTESTVTTPGTDVKCEPTGGPASAGDALRTKAPRPSEPATESRIAHRPSIFSRIEYSVQR